MSQRVCVVLCPDWPIVAACLDEDTPDAVWGEAMMVIHSGRVTSCSPEARAEGIRVGQRLRDAHNACPQVRRLSWSPERDQRIFAALLTSLSDVVPIAGVIEPGIVHLGARGIVRYYGSEAASARAITDALRTAGAPCAIAVGYADTLFAATQAATQAIWHPNSLLSVAPGGDRDFLSTLPTAVWGDDAMAELCTQLGITTLGQFALLERDHVTERFGQRGTLLHQLASGEDPRHHNTADIPPSHDVVWRSDEPCESGEQLSFLVAESASRFIDQLLDLGCVTHTVDITLVDDRGDAHRTRWSHPRYFTAVDLTHRVRWQGQEIARHSGDEEYHRGIVEVRFVAKQPDSATGYEESLWGNAHRDTALTHTISSLQASLGHHMVTQVTTRPGHTLTDTHHAAPWGDRISAPDTDAVDSWAGQLPAPFPATVFSRPLPISLVDHTGAPVNTLGHGAQLSSTPHHIISQGRVRGVVAWAGPWPVLERWWESPPTRCWHRVQLVDDTGMGWLIKTIDGEGNWVAEARYD